MTPIERTIVAGAILVASAFIGSFLGVVIRRLPADRPIILGRSTCEACRHGLAPIDLVPLASWLILSGRCRHCGARIGRFAPIVELAAMVIALVALVVVPADDPAALAATLVLGWWLLVIAWIDAETYLLPDRLSLPLVALGLVVTTWLGRSDWSQHALAAGLGFAVLELIDWVYRRLRGRSGLGGGDSRLFAAAGAWLGWSGLASVLLLASIFGLVQAACQHATGRAISRDTEMPFGPALALAIWCVWLFGPILG